MCGIAGIISSFPNQVSPTAIEKMTRSIAHRGPDGEGFWNNDNSTVLLGHRRLSIIDLTTAANQPMNYLNRYYVVHNGEIYNYIELKDTLRKKGYSFISHSDTEVILAAYDCYKENCLRYMDGMFAFAIWDEQEKKLFAARDRFGEKPFYYFFDSKNQLLYFASELKAFWAIGLTHSINETMLLNYLTQGYTTDPTDSNKTFYTDLLKLPAAHYLTFHPFAEKKEVSITRYWKLNTETAIPKSKEEAVKQFALLFNRSVATRLRADVSIGTSLSGGLDSSSIVASIQQQSLISPQYGQQTFTAGFLQFEKDETAFAKQVAAQFGLTQFITYPSAGDLALELEKLILHHEEPISSSSVYAQYKVFELAKQHHVSVLLDGQGADEILAGYSKYIHWYLQELLAKGKFNAFRKEKELLSSHGIPFEWTYYNYAASVFPGIAARQLLQRAKKRVTKNNNIREKFKKAFLQEDGLYKPTIRSVNDILYYNTCTLGLEELLRYADKNSMAHGREVRLPFLQHELVQYIFSLPASYKINGGFTKWILRKTMEPVLPSQIVWRTDKTGFEPPQKKWMENKSIQELIITAKENLVKQQVLNEAVLTEKIQPHSAYAADCNDWRYLTAGLLYT